MRRWLRLAFVVLLGLGLLAGALWLHDQIIVQDRDPFTGNPRTAAPRPRMPVQGHPPPPLPEVPDARIDSSFGPPEVDPAEVPDMTAFGRPDVVVRCDVSALTTAGQGLYVSHDVIRSGERLVPGAQPALLQNGEARIPALSNQSEALISFEDAGLVRMTWEKTPAGDVTCDAVDVVAPLVPVQGTVQGEQGPLADVSVVGCGGIARTGPDGRFLLRAAAESTCRLHAVRFDGEATIWGPAITWRPSPATHLVLQWEDPPQ